MQGEISRYWSQGSTGYDKCVKAQFHSKRDYAFWQRWLIHGLGGQREQNVLDVGTGPGFFSVLLAEMGHHVTAVDAAPGMVEVAAQNFAARGLPVKLYLSDAANLNKEEDGAFDAVVCRDVTWTLPEPEKAYREWLRVLKPGGKLVIIDGNYHYHKYTLGRKIWKALAGLLILASEKRIPNSRHFPDEVLRKLPNVNRLRPQEDVKILSGLGYEIVEVVDDIYKGNRTNIEYLKYGYQSKKFMIVARNPVS